MRFENQTRRLDAADVEQVTRASLNAEAVIMRDIIQDVIAITGEASSDSINEGNTEIDHGINNLESTIETNGTSNVPSGNLDSWDQTLARENNSLHNTATELTNNIENDESSRLSRWVRNRRE